MPSSAPNVLPPTSLLTQAPRILRYWSNFTILLWPSYDMISIIEGHFSFRSGEIHFTLFGDFTPTPYSILDYATQGVAQLPQLSHM